MATQTITTDRYKLYPSPRNAQRVLFGNQLFVPNPWEIIDLPAMRLTGAATLFAACRLADMKMGQLVSFELACDQARFEQSFRPG